MSYIDEEKIFTLETKLEAQWNAESVLIYDTYILVAVDKNPAYYIPFTYNNKLVRIA